MKSKNKNTKTTAQNKTKRLKEKKINPLDKLKEEVASELGLMDKVKEVGWGGLTAAESGRVGGIMTRRLKAEGKIPPSKTKIT